MQSAQAERRHPHRVWLTFDRQRAFQGLESMAPAGDLQELAKKTCLRAYLIDKTVSGVEPSASWSIRYTGTKCGGPGGVWVIESAGTQIGLNNSGNAELSGPLVVQ